jgi:hypothetical protein
MKNPLLKSKIKMRHRKINLLDRVYKKVEPDSTEGGLFRQDKNIIIQHSTIPLSLTSQYAKSEKISAILAGGDNERAW